MEERLKGNKNLLRRDHDLEERASPSLAIVSVNSFQQMEDVASTSNVKSKFRWTSLYARDRDSKNRLAYNEFAYKKTKDNCKLEDRFQENGHFSIAHTRNRR